MFFVVRISGFCVYRENSSTDVCCVYVLFIRSHLYHSDRKTWWECLTDAVHPIAVCGLRKRKIVTADRVEGNYHKYYTVNKRHVTRGNCLYILLLYDEYIRVTCNSLVILIITGKKNEKRPNVPFIFQSYFTKLCTMTHKNVKF